MADPTLIARAQALIQQGQGDAALAMLREGQQNEPRNADIPLNIAMALRRAGDLTGALSALDQTLALEPYHFVALLSKGGVLEQLNQLTNAAQVYANALKIAPPTDRLPSSMAAALGRANALVGRRNQALVDHLRQATAHLRGSAESRTEEAIDILAGVKKPFVHEPTLLNFPRLPAIPFFDRDYFPWLGQLEAATDGIRDELMVLLREDQARFRPYIQYPSGAPVNQWVALNHSPSWSALHLWRDGRREEAMTARCPFTTSVLEGLPMADQEGYAPTAMFSVLAPHTHIPPHTGSTNVRLIVHLPLILPPHCMYRVGNISKPWRMGQAWVFDDTIEHEARNDSDELRALLIFDVWNPLLSSDERAAVAAMMRAYASFSL